MLRLVRFFALLAGLFLSAAAQSQTITVTQPNGGEVLYACQQYTIQWNTSGSLSEFYDIDYSLDGGVIWASVTSNFLAPSHQFTWTVPDVQSSTVLIRVEDSQNTSVVDQSDSLFTINIPVIVTTPNGGEVWQGNTTQDITWIGNGTSNSYNIAYSLNGGSSYFNIVSNHSSSTGVYSWLVPNIPSTSVKVRVQDVVTGCMIDDSDSLFTITAATPELLTPNGGESVYPNCTQQITWDPGSFFSNVRLEYSADSGATWNTITSSTSNDGFYNWTPPNDPSETALIRALNTTNFSIGDTSDAVFTIEPPITVLTPNGGSDTLYGCDQTTISWRKAKNCIGTFFLDYSTNGGSSWSSITSVFANSSTVQSYNWTIPNGITSSQVKVRVRASSSVSTPDESDSTFTILPSNVITVSSPNGGETFTGLTTATVSWTNTSQASGIYNVAYSTNGSSYSSIASNITGNSTSWSVPNSPTTNGYIRVQDNQTGCYQDFSDAPFTIEAAKPILTAPNGGESVYPNCTQTITWNTQTFTTSVRLEYSLDSGATWNLITSNRSNVGSYSWTPPNIQTTTALVRALSVSNLSVGDTSDAVFTIEPSITVLTPNGGSDTLYGCDQTTISWRKAKNCIGTFFLDYSTNGGSSWSGITSVFANSSTVQNYNWTIPNGITSSQVKVRVRASSSASTPDESDSTFTILPSNVITVSSPNGGETFTGLTTGTVSWTNTSQASGAYNVSYSTNGSSYSSIASNITGNSTNWSVPNSPTTNGYIRVQDNQTGCYQDFSDAPFTIEAAKPVLTAPNGGESIYPNCTQTITWNTQTFTTSVRLEYSLDSGATWNLITANRSNVGSYSWTPPNIQTTTALIRALSVSNLSVGDTSDAVFTIEPSITVLTPNGGSDTLYGCDQTTISWRKAKNCIGTFFLDYSTDGGSNWSGITSVFANSSTIQSYNWTIPNGITSSQVKVRVRASSSASTPDESDSTFTILPSNVITVTSPNGGETFTGLTTATVSWTNTSQASGAYNVSYSTNGSSYSSIASNITGNSTSWSVPNSPTTNGYIRVQDNQTGCYQDFSDAPFTIEAAKPVLIAPNGGESIYPNCTQTITWNTQTFTTSVRLEYSLDSGANWNLITANRSNVGSYSWTPPNIQTTTALIRALSVSNLSVGDTSDAVFTIEPSITVLTPNGGSDTLYGCDQTTISWRKAKNCIGTFFLDYSTDGGSNWSGITSVFANSSTVQSYNWTIPNGITSSQVKVRVRASSSASTPDESDSTFTILPSNVITVTSPNGGETFTGLTTGTVTWTNTSQASGAYNVSYSTNGSSYSSIASNITGNSTSWSIPNSPTTNGYIRVQDNQTGCYQDFNDAPFTIEAAKPVLTSPNGGESVYPNCTQTITWNTQTFTTSVRLEYSLDSGATWNLITASRSNVGSYSWTPPNSPTTTALVRALSVSNLSVGDTSDAVFTIQPSITVIAPNGGSDTLYGCDQTTISWRKSKNCIGTFFLDYSTDGGSNWSGITSVFANSSTVQNYNWTIPNGITSSQVKVRVRASSSASTPDESDSTFTILPKYPVTITSPNGGESYQGFTNQTITWSNTQDASGLYTVNYSTNGGSSWTSIASNISGNSATWTVPNSPTSQGLIRLFDFQNNCFFDVSDAPFDITPADPLLTSPNGGEVWYAGLNRSITWDASTFYSSVRLEYSLDNGASWVTITSSTSNDGQYTWNVPNANSTTALIKASNTADVSINDVSNAVFTIKPAVTIVTPNGDDGITQWGGCTVTSITWERSTAWNTYRIQYSADSGLTWNTITSNFFTNSNPATYNWTMPNIDSDKVLVKVYPTSVPAYEDVSDNTFTIDQPVVILQPTFGGALQVGTTFDIQWLSDGISNVYDLAYSINGGTGWTPIINGLVTSTNTYSWTVPNQLTNNGLIRVRDNIDNCKEDVSTYPFTITTSTPPLTLVTPNGGDTLDACTIVTIDWTETQPLGNYDIAYSLDNATSWIDIVTNYNAPGTSYDWTVPNLNSSSVLVRVQETGSSIQDISDALFTIESQSAGVTPTVAISSNSGNAICSGAQVDFNAVAVNAGSNPDYQWLLNGSPVGANQDSYSSNTLQDGDTVEVVLVSDLACANTDSVLSAPIVMQASTVPGTPGTISGVGSLCVGDTATYSVTADPAVSSYTWTLPSGWTGSSTGNSITITAGSLDGDLEVIATNGCGSSAEQTKAVTSAALPTVVGQASASEVCSGESVTLNGAGADSYTWDLGVQNGTSFNPVATQTYTVVGIDSNGCSDSGQVVIAVNALPSVGGSASSSGVCLGDSVTLTGSGADTYSWNFGVDDGVAFSPSSSTTYTVTGTDSNGCENTAQVSVDVNALPTISAATTAMAVCDGDQVTLTATGASLYNWDQGVVNGVAFAPPATTTYTVTGTDSNGCDATDQIQITVNSLPVVGASANPAQACAGSPVVLQGTGALTYSWDQGVTDGASFNPTTSAVYQVTGTDANGCAATSQVSVSVLAAPNVVAAATDTLICAGTTVTLTGSGAATYSWDQGVTDGTAFSPSSTQTYQVTGTDANGCVATDQVEVVVLSNPVVAASTTASAVCQGEAVTLTGAGASTYTWTAGVSDGVAFNPATSATYTVTGTDANGCSDTSSVAIVVNALPTVSGTASLPGVCLGDSLSLSGQGASTYTWNFGVQDGQEFAPSSNQTYELTGTDGNGCSATAQVSVTVWSPPLVGANASVSTVCAGESVTIWGTGASNFAWNNGVLDSIAFTPNSNQTYVVTGTDSNGCIATDSIALQVSALPNVVAASSTDTICPGEAVTLTGSGAVTYSWDNAVTNALPFNPSATTIYTVTGTDANGCENTDQLVVAVLPSPAVAGIASSASICLSDSVTLTGSGASSYTWDQGVVDGQAFAPTTSETYQVTGTDANGCVATAQVTINVLSPPTVVANASAASVCSGDAVTVWGTGAETFSWNGSVTDSIAFTPGAAQFYVVTGTDSNGCSAQDSVQVSILASPTVVAATSNDTICEGTQVTLNGTGAITYNWDSGVTDAVAFSPTTTAVYSVTGTDLNGCTDTDQIVVAVLAAPTVSATASDTAICEGSSVTLNGSGANTYSWDQGVTDGLAFAPTTTGTYQVTGTDGNGCEATAQVQVSVLALPTVNANTSLATVCPGDSVTLWGVGAATYSWNGGVTDSSAFAPMATQFYQVTGTDANGCSAVDSVEVTVLPAPTVAAATTDSTICIGDQVTLTGSGAVLYSWDNGVTDAAPFSPTTTAIYTVTGTDFNGCEATAQIAVTVLQLPTVSASATASTLCLGDSTTLSGSGASTYAWDQGALDGQGFAPASTAIYTVTGTDANGCSDTAQVNITVFAVPQVAAAASVNALCAGDSLTLTGSGAQSYQWNNGVIDGLLFAPTNSTTYTVTGTDGNGCQGTDQVFVEVFALPQVQAASTAPTVCEGEPVAVTAGGAETYVWDQGVTDGVLFIPTTTENYTVTGTDTNGCSASFTITVVVFPLPVVNAGADQSICDGEELVLSGSGAFSYSWNNGVQDQVPFTPTSSDSYILTGSDLNGCEGVDTVEVTLLPTPFAAFSNVINETNGGDGEIDLSVTAGTPPYVFDWNNDGTGDFDDTEDLTGLVAGLYIVTVQDDNGCIDTLSTVLESFVSVEDVNELDHAFKVFPNPSRGLFMLRFEQDQHEDVNLTAFDLSGRVVYSQSEVVPGKGMVVDLTGEAEGVYVLEVAGEDWVQRVRLVVSAN